MLIARRVILSSALLFVAVVAGSAYAGRSRGSSDSIIDSSRPHAMLTTHAAPTGGATDEAPPLLIDGDKTPEAIPDFVAYRHFLVAVASLSRGVTKADLDRRDAYLANRRHW